MTDSQERATPTQRPGGGNATTTNAGNNETESDKFRRLFGQALHALNRNIAAWQAGITWPQVQALRAECAASGVEFEPTHYRRENDGRITGQVGQHIVSVDREGLLTHG